MELTTSNNLLQEVPLPLQWGKPVQDPQKYANWRCAEILTTQIERRLNRGNIEGILDMNHYCDATLIESTFQMGPSVPYQADEVAKITRANVSKLSVKGASAVRMKADGIFPYKSIFSPKVFKNYYYSLQLSSQQSSS